MKNIIFLLSVITFTAPLAHADAIYSGTIYGEGEEEFVCTVDHIPFTHHTAGPVIIDVLSWEFDGSEFIDVNGDGEIAFLDTYIHLFRDDGELDVGDYMSGNDDSGIDTNGSLSGLDSYLEGFLSAGDFILAISCYNLTVEDATTNFNPDSIPLTGEGEEEFIFLPHDHGDYRIDFIGDITVTPEPATLSLLALGGLLIRKRK